MFHHPRHLSLPNRCSTSRARPQSSPAARGTSSTGARAIIVDRFFMVFLRKTRTCGTTSRPPESSRTSPVSPLSPGPPRLSWRRRPDTHDSFEILRQPLAVTCDLLQVRAFLRVASEEASCKLLTVNWTNPGGNPDCSAATVGRHRVLCCSSSIHVKAFK
jgi:hypothetical protein